MIRRLIAVLLFPSLLTATAAVRADEVRKEIFKVEDKLTRDDARDNVFKKSFQKVHSVKLAADQLVRIEMSSKDFSAYLRLENADGKVQASRAFGAGKTHFVFKPKAAGDYRLVVTTAQPEKTGEYVLTLLEGILVDQRDGLRERAVRLSVLAGPERSTILADVRDYLKKRGGQIDLDDAILAQLACRALERSPDAAARAFADFMELLSKTTDKRALQHMETMESSSRRLRLLGKNLTFKGTTVDGKEFDLAQYKGKIVLIDFWATWCGPCRAEMPNVVKNYEKYKAKGFEVVGISLDANRDALEKFLEKEALPWICLHEKESKGRNPTATMVGVATIPTCILIDRNGKVISLQARGAYLGELLEKHIDAR